MNLDQFITKYNGKSVANNHGGFVGECVSLAARKVQEVDNVPNGDAVLYCQTTGGARDLYENPTNLLLTYYTRIPNGQPRQRGDLVVWGSTLGQYGDVAIALDSGTQLFGQLGTPVFIPANIRDERRQPLGYLRKIGVNMATLVDDGNVNLLYKMIHRDDSQITQAMKDASRGKVFVNELQRVFESDEYRLQDKTLKNPPSGGGTPLAPGTYIVKG